MQKSVLQLNYQLLQKEELQKQLIHAKYLEKAKLEIDVLALKKMKLEKNLGIAQQQGPNE